MPITLVSGKIIYSAKTDRWNSDYTGVFGDQDFAVSDELFPLKQLKFNMTPMTDSYGILVEANPATSGSITLTWPATSGTIALVGSGTGITQLTFQGNQGTYPVLNSVDNVLSFTSTELDITGNSTTDSFLFEIKAEAVTNAKLRHSVGRSVIGRDNSTTGNPADIQAAANSNYVLRESGNTLGFGLIVNANIDSAAAIAFSKFAALTSGNILVGNASNVATSVAMSGDITITNAGVTAIGANKVQNTMIRTSGARTVIGRAGNTSGNVADIAATASSNHVLKETAGIISFGLLTNDNIAASGTANIALNKLNASTPNAVAQFGSTGYLEASTIANNQLATLDGIDTGITIQDQLNNIITYGPKDISYERRKSTETTLPFFITPLFTGGDPTSVSYGTGYINYYPINVAKKIRASQVRFEVTVDGFINGVIGIYTSKNMLPFELIEQTAEFDDTVGVRLEALGSSPYLDPGVYWIAFMVSDSAGEWRAKYASQVIGVACADHNQFGDGATVLGVQEAFTYASTFPTTADPTTALVNIQVPIIGIYHE